MKLDKGFYMGTLMFWDTIIRMVVSTILGGIIGLEREKKGRSAGLRTHILVCVGSTLIMLTALYLYEAYDQTGSFNAGKIAAGVVTGIGFLGGGTIIKSGQEARGLTTAASIWICAGVGLAVGCGYFIAALMGTAIAFFTLFALKYIENTHETEV